MVGIPDKWFAIVNPVAGQGKGLDDWPILSKQLREWHIIPDYAFTEYRYHATELLVQALADGYRKIIVVGGDGTIHEVMNGLFIQQIVPLESVVVGVIVVGNDSAAARYGFPCKYSEAVRAIAEGNTRYHKICKLLYHDSHYRQERHFAIEAHVGFETYVKRRYNRLRDAGKKGVWRRVRSLFKALLRYRPTGMKIWVDGVLEVNDLVYGTAVKIISSGSEVKYPDKKTSKKSGRFADHREIVDIRPGDDFLKLAVVKRIKFFSAIFHLRALYASDLYRFNDVEYYYGRHIKIESSPEAGLDADGEIMGFSPMEFVIDDRAIKLVVADKRS